MKGSTMSPKDEHVTTFVEIATATEDLRQRLLQVYDALDARNQDCLPDCVRQMKDDIRRSLRYLSHDSDVARPFGLRVAQYLAWLDRFRDAPTRTTHIAALEGLAHRPADSLDEYMKGVYC
jgi:hypothetical protein